MRSPNYPINERPFKHRCRFGTEFQADRCDFVGGINVHCYPDITKEQLASDVAQMIGFHAMNILPDCNGFSGYDGRTWNFHDLAE